MGDKLKILIVDDATFMRRAIAKMLEADPTFQVVDSAQNGLEALQKIRTLKPDIVTLDIDMPVMDGLSAIRHIMIECPLPIVVLSSLFHDGAITFEALRLGVVDFIPKPSGAISLNIDRMKQQIIDRVKIAQHVKLRNLRRVRLLKTKDRRKPLEQSSGNGTPEYIIAVGTTLSGPNTIIRLISKLSAALPASIVVVQEVSPRILPSFVERFDQFVPWRVEPAQEGTVLTSGTCYISSNEHAVAIRTNLQGLPYLSLGERVDEPLNLVFSSAAATFHEKTLGVLLTGTGDDGAEGFAQIQQRKGITIVEDKKCCVYPNLVDQAIKRGVVDHVFDESILPRAIEYMVTKARRGC